MALTCECVLSQILFIVFINLARRNILQYKDMEEIWDKRIFVRDFVVAFLFVLPVRPHVETRRRVAISLAYNFKKRLITIKE